MNEKFNSGNGKENIFAVSTEWFRIWQKFVCGDSEGTQQLFNFCEVVPSTFKAVLIACNFFDD